MGAVTSSGRKPVRHAGWRLALSGLATVALVATATAAAASDPAMSGTPAPGGSPAAPASIDPRVQAEMDAATTGEDIEYLVVLDAAPDLATVTGDREAVVSALQQTAERSQAALVRRLERRGATVVNQFWLHNAVLVRGRPGTVTAASMVEGVARVAANADVEVPEPVESEPVAPESTVATVGDRTWGIDRIGADRVWEELGVRGDGVRVATLDTGVDLDHRDLTGKLATDDPDDPSFPGGWMEFDAAGQLVASQPHDSAAHGTHVAGTIHGGAGSGVAIGVAPAAEMMHGLVIPGGNGTLAQVIAGMQWAIDPTDADGNPAGEPADVINMSLGACGIAQEMVPITRNIESAGVFPSFSIGNAHPFLCPACGPVGAGSPGNVYEAVGVGATDIDDNVAAFSCGATMSRDSWPDPPADWPETFIKPDISAPGVDVRSAVPGDGYAVQSGTSMAAPHVSGTVALMRAANPTLSVAEATAALQATSFWDDRHGAARPNSRFGHGRIDTFAAVSEVAVPPEQGVSGTVTDAGSDEPVAGATVVVVGQGRSVTTDDRGRYRLGLPPGRYDLALSAFGYADAEPDVVVEPERFTTVDVALDPLPVGAVGGTVTLADSGRTVPGVTVALAGTPLRATTGDDGSYHIEDVPVGEYHVDADPAMFPAPPRQDATVAEDERVQVDIALDCGRVCSGEELWVARHDGDASSLDIANDVGVGPDGDTVYVTGESAYTSHRDYATLAYDATTGEKLWESTYDGPAESLDIAYALAVSNDGARVYVTGQSNGDTGVDYATVAYDAASGEELWVSHYNGPGTAPDLPIALALSPDDGTVYVTGESAPGRFVGVGDYATVAYDAATGEQRWVARYAGPGDARDRPRDLGVSPDGDTVYVTGTSEAGSGIATTDYATIAYHAATGEQRWVSRYDNGNRDIANALSVGPDGSAVYVTGISRSGTTEATNDYATIAYDPATGDERWLTRYDGPVAGPDTATTLGVSPDGSRVIVSGQSFSEVGRDLATVSYDAVTGEQQWVSRYHGGRGARLAISPDGTGVYVIGVTDAREYATVRYETDTGGERWASVYSSGLDHPHALAVGPDSDTVYVTGESSGDGSGLDYATIAYRDRDEFPVPVPYDLRVEPDTVLSDQPAEVSVAVANVGDAAGDYTATVSVDGVPEDSTTVALEPGARTRVRWSVSREDLASYRVEVAHLTAELVVRAPASYRGLAQMVAELADDGAVTPAGTARLTATLGQSERWAERGIVARAIAHLERFQEIAADARFVPDATARDTLTSEADQLIAQLSAER